MPSLRMIAGAQLLLAVLILGGVWLLLPARWLWVDAPATLLGVACAVTAVALWRQVTWATRFARVVLWAELVIGSLACTLLALSAAQLVGSYGPVGAGGAALLITIAV